jgi:hypothetical protein
MAYLRTETIKTGAARIGRTGKKLHPAKIVRIVFDDRTVNALEFGCNCGGTMNGHAQHKAQFFENVQSNCGKR